VRWGIVSGGRGGCDPPPLQHQCKSSTVVGARSKRRPWQSAKAYCPRVLRPHGEPVALVWVATSPA
jgi:hypothetical protein